MYLFLIAGNHQPFGSGTLRKGPFILQQILGHRIGKAFSFLWSIQRSQRTHTSHFQSQELRNVFDGISITIWTRHVSNKQIDFIDTSKYVGNTIFNGILSELSYVMYLFSYKMIDKQCGTQRWLFSKLNPQGAGSLRYYGLIINHLKNVIIKKW